MTIEKRLKNALRSVEDALQSLNRAKYTDDQDAAYKVRQAISDLQDAESDIKRAIRELPS